MVGSGTVVGVSRRVHARARCAVSEVPQAARDDTARSICKIYHQGSIPRPGCGGKVCLGFSVGRDVAGLNTGDCSTGSRQGKRHRVGAGLTIGNGRVPDFTRLAVSKAPEHFFEASNRSVAKMYFQGALPLVGLAVKKGIYVPVVEALCPPVMVTVWLEGAVQPCRPLKATVCDPTLRLDTVDPLACELPPSTLHIAPSRTAPTGLIVTVREPL